MTRSTSASVAIEVSPGVVIPEFKVLGAAGGHRFDCLIPSTPAIEVIPILLDPGSV
jgi:hypothetical protein